MRFASLAAAGTFVSTLFLGACSGDLAPTAPSLGTAGISAQGEIQILCRIRFCPPVARLYVTNFNGNSLTSYPRNADGNVSPTSTIAGSNTGLDTPADVAFGRFGNMYVADAIGAINEYAFGADGNVRPVATIAGSNTGLSDPSSIALDRSGKIYVANFSSSLDFPTPGSITVYRAGANGNVSPIATIAGSNSAFAGLSGLAIDASGKIYAASETYNFSAPAILIFAAGASGNASPIATITGSNTGLNGPQHIALDGAGNIYVANTGGIAVEGEGSGNVLVYAAGATGNVSPMATIAGSMTGLSDPEGIALDDAGNMYVANLGCGEPCPTSVTVYAAGAHGNVAPIATIAGSKTGLNGASSIAIYTPQFRRRF
jgi:hypothetical protein